MKTLAQVQAALERFKQAAADLDEAWDPALYYSEPYPAWLPSFDEAVDELVKMQIKAIEDWQGQPK